MASNTGDTLNMNGCNLDFSLLKKTLVSLYKRLDTVLGTKSTKILKIQCLLLRTLSPSPWPEYAKYWIYFPTLWTNKNVFSDFYE